MTERKLATVALVVPDYEAAIDFYVRTLGFDLLENRDLGHGKRWVVVAPGDGGAKLLLAKAVGAEQCRAIGNQAGGRVFLFLETDDFPRDHAAMLAKGVVFEDAPRTEPYGTVGVFQDPFGNRWDLIEPSA